MLKNGFIKILSTQNASTHSHFRGEKFSTLRLFITQWNHKYMLFRVNHIITSLIFNKNCLRLQENIFVAFLFLDLCLSFYESVFYVTYCIHEKE